MGRLAQQLVTDWDGDNDCLAQKHSNSICPVSKLYYNLVSPKSSNSRINHPNATKWRSRVKTDESKPSHPDGQQWADHVPTRQSCQSSTMIMRHFFFRYDKIDLDIMLIGGLFWFK